MTPTLQDRFQGALLGLATGDAVGTTLEFQRPGTFEPLTDMVGGGPFRLKPGEWTDDTSMALCLAESLLHADGHDPVDQLTRYVRWRDEGCCSVTGHCFDIGNTVASALRRFEATGTPDAGSTDPHSAGNGCTMRLAPVPMFFFGRPTELAQACADSARTTHGAQACLESSSLFGTMIWHALRGDDRDAVFSSGASLPLGRPEVRAIAEGAWRTKTRAQIRGSGYVVDGLEAALWCVARTSTFREAVLLAANLGDDADTTAAVAGQLAGALYGASGIPPQWRQRLAWHDRIQDTADRLFARGTAWTIVTR